MIQCKKERKPTMEKKKPSAWEQGMKAAAIATVLVAMNSRYLNSAELVGRLITSFVVWTLIFSAIVAVWRKIK